VECRKLQALWLHVHEGPTICVICRTNILNRMSSILVFACLQGRAEMYDTVVGIGVDPRNIAQRIMDVSSEAWSTCTCDLSAVRACHVKKLMERAGNVSCEHPCQGIACSGYFVNKVAFSAADPDTACQRVEG
jgi:hypothetical protein